MRDKLIRNEVNKGTVTTISTTDGGKKENAVIIRIFSIKLKQPFCPIKQTNLLKSNECFNLHQCPEICSLIIKIGFVLWQYHYTRRLLQTIIRSFGYDLQCDTKSSLRYPLQPTQEVNELDYNRSVASRRTSSDVLRLCSNKASLPTSCPDNVPLGIRH